MGIIVVILMFGLWSTVFPLGKQTLDFSPPIFLTAVRMLLAGFLIVGYMVIKDRKALRLSRQQWLSLGLLGVLSIYLTNILELWGLQFISAAKACFIYSLSPFLAALFSYIHFREKMTRTKWIGMSIGFLGFLPILFLQTGTESFFKTLAGLTWPELALIGAALFSVYGWVLLRVAVKDQMCSPLIANGMSMLMGGTLALGHSFAVESWNFGIATAHFGPVTEILPFAGGVLIMTLISNLICFNLYGLMLKKYTATLLSFAGLLSPIFASFSAWAILGEAPSPIIFLSTGILCCGLWIVYREELAQGYFALTPSEEPTST